MNIKTYFDKTNTIVYNSPYNTSQNPVCELYYGDGYTRVLLYIDTNKLKGMVDDKTFSDTNKLKHTLVMKNCWGLQSIDSKILFNSGKNSTKERTSSFDLFLLRMPEQWDSGSGNDFTKDGFITKNYSISENGSNWFSSKTGSSWTNGFGAVSGITSGNTITTQHFDIGDENIEMDITNEINNIISGVTENNGFMLCFPTELEKTTVATTQYIGFFTNKTTTFFKPYLETTYQDYIVDDRANFYLDKDNRIYFYSIIGGDLTNLDVIPTCTIDFVTHTVKQATKGVYYIEINLSSEDHSVDTMFYDTWSNIVYKSKQFPDVELEFTTKNPNNYFNFGNSNYEQKKYIPTIHGIKYGEKINSGDVKKIFVNTRVEYTTNKVEHIAGIEYRLYVKETDKEITVIDYHPVNMTYNSNYFMLYVGNLLPNKYFIDIKIKRNDEEIYHKEKLTFDILNELK